MKVVCIDNGGYERHLTIGKVYINDGDIHRYAVISDADGQWIGCYSNNFIMYEQWLSLNRSEVIDDILS